MEPVCIENTIWYNYNAPGGHVEPEVAELSVRLGTTYGEVCEAIGACKITLKGEEGRPFRKSEVIRVISEGLEAHFPDGKDISNLVFLDRVHTFNAKQKEPESS